MKKTLTTFGLILFLSFPFVLFSQTLTAEIEGDILQGQLGNAVAISSDGNILALGIHSAVPGQVRVYRKNNNDWTQIGDDLNVDEISGAFGDRIALAGNGNVIAVGATRNQDDRGLVQVFQNVNDSWIPIGENIIGDESSDRFGKSLAISDDGNTLAIGATGIFGADSFSTIGYVKVFQNVDNEWIQSGDNLIGEEIRSYFGTSVALSPDGSILGVGAPGILTATIGHVKVFQNNNNTWTQLGGDINGESMRDRFGASMDFSSDGNNTIVIGAHGSNSQGTETIGYAKVFNFSNNTWNPVGSTIYSDEPRDLFGSSVSISSDGNVVAVGIPGFRPTPDEFPDGKVKIYETDGNNWFQAGTELIDESNWGQHFGVSVALSADGKTLAVGDHAFKGRVGKVSIYENIPSNTIQIKENQLTIYPNPTSGLLHIDGFPINQMRLFDAFGSNLKIENKPTSTIDISTLSAGVYFLRLEIEGEFYNSKIVKQ